MFWLMGVILLTCSQGCLQMGVRWLKKCFKKKIKLAWNSVMCLQKSRVGAKVQSVTFFFLWLQWAQGLALNACHLGLQGTLVMNISSKCLLPHFALGKKCLTQTEFNQSANLFQVSPASSVNVLFSSLHCCWKQFWKPFFNKIYLICENNLLCIAGV